MKLEESAAKNFYSMASESISANADFMINSSNFPESFQVSKKIFKNVLLFFSLLKSIN